MIKAAIFDCFGVLAEDGWLPLKRKYIGNDEALAEQIANLGRQNELGFVDNDQVTKRMAELMRIDVEILKKALNKRIPNEQLMTFIKLNLKPHYKIGFMSNANYDVLHQLFTPKQAACFDAAVTSFEAKLIKPDERMYLLMTERLGVQPNECLYIDNQERYCLPAEQLGMQAIIYKNNEQLFSDLDQILGLKHHD